MISFDSALDITFTLPSFKRFLLVALGFIRYKFNFSQATFKYYFAILYTLEGITALNLSHLLCYFDVCFAFTYATNTNALLMPLE